LEQIFAVTDGGDPRDMNTERAVAAGTQYYARPGRMAIVVSDLASLRKPSRGTTDRDTLIALRPELHRSEGVRAAWEEHHPRLRAG
jgi:hypothetical protein